MRTIVKEFLGFLNEYKIVSLAVAFVMGSASTTLVNALVKDVLMPIVEPLMTSESWRQATLRLGPVNIAYGAFVAELLNFVILAFIVFVVAKKILKQEVPKKKGT